MKTASIRTMLAAACLMLVSAPGEAAHYVMTSGVGTASFSPPKFPGTVTLRDQMIGSFDAADGLTEITLGDLSSFTMSVSHDELLSFFSQPPVLFSSGDDYGLSALTSFSYKVDVPGSLYLAVSGGTPTRILGNSIIVGSGSGQPYTVSGVSVALAAVPEPASWAMMVAGFGLVGWVIRGRARRPGSALA